MKLLDAVAPVIHIAVFRLEALWSSMELRRFPPWSSVERRGAPSSAVELHGASVDSVHGTPWSSVDLFWPRPGLSFFKIKTMLKKG